MNEDYVSFEVAKILKEKGFNEHLCVFYDERGKMQYDSRGRMNFGNDCVAPTIHMVSKWLRTHHIYIDICTLNVNKFSYRICVLSDTTGFLCEFRHSMEDEIFRTYEDALSSAIKSCVKNLDF